MPDLSQYNDDFPVHIGVFLNLIQNTPDEIWAKLLRNKCAQEKHSEREWARILIALKKE